MIRTREPMTLRYRLKRLGGDYMYVNIFCRITENAQGVFLNSYYTDATELINEEEKQKALLDNLPAGAGIYELDGGEIRLIYQNKSYWELVGLGGESYVDPSPMSAIHPNDVPVIMDEIVQAIQNRRDVSCDIRLRHVTLGYIGVKLSGRIVPRESGSFLIFALFTPVSDAYLSFREMLPIALSAVMNAQTEYVFVKDKDLRYICLSKQLARLVGCESEAELVGKTDADFLDKSIAEAFEAEDLKVISTGEPLIDSYVRIPVCDGEDIYTCTSKFPLKDSKGNTVGVYGIGRDATEAHSMKTRFELLTDSIPGGIASYEYRDGEIKLTYFNDGFCRLFDITRERCQAVCGNDVYHGIYAEDLPLLKAQIDALVSDGVQADCLYRVRLSGGDHKWINLKASCTGRGTEKVTFNAVLLDVTRRQDAIELARINEEENRLAVELGGNIMARYQISDRTLTVTSHVAQVYSLPEVIRNVPDEPIRAGMIAPESAEQYAGFFMSILRGSKAAAATFRQKYLNQWRWMEAKSTTIFSDDDRPVKAVISFRDVTDQVEKETIYKKWKQSMRDRKPETYTMFRFNLNTDAAIADNEGSLITFDFDSVGLSVRERTRAYINDRVLPADRDLVTKFLNPDMMLADYYRGRRANSIDYREALKNGGAGWRRLTVDLVEYPNSTDVEAYLMCEDIDETKVSDGVYEKVDDIGNIAFMTDTQAFELELAKAKSDYHSEIEYQFILSPVGQNGGFAYLSPADGLAINNRSDNIDWALEFLNFFFTPENNRAFAEKAGKIPNTSDALLQFDVPTDRTSDVGQMTFGYGFYKTVVTLMGTGYDDMVGISKMTAQKYMKDNGDGTYGIMFTLEDYMARLEAEFLKAKEAR